MPPATSPDHEFADWPMPDALPSAQTRPNYATTDDTVTDNVTHLVWQRKLPANYSGCAGYPDAGVPVGSACKADEAEKYCESPAVVATLGGSGWRLPTKIELDSILDETRYAPAIDPEVFPNTSGLGFWTSTPRVAGGIWVVSFGDGGDVHAVARETNLVRCVRDQ